MHGDDDDEAKETHNDTELFLGLENCKIVLTDQISATLVSADQALPIVK